MPQIPTVGQQAWGSPLNAFLSTAIDPTTGELRPEATAALTAALVALQEDVDALESPVVSHIHIQSVASTNWTIEHNLGYRPAGIQVFDSTGDQWVSGDIEHTDVNTTVITWTSAFSGTAYLS